MCILFLSKWILNADFSNPNLISSCIFKILSVVSAYLLRVFVSQLYNGQVGFFLLKT
jgi:hypothetical protein